MESIRAECNNTTHYVGLKRTVSYNSKRYMGSTRAVSYNKRHYVGQCGLSVTIKHVICGQ